MRTYLIGDAFVTYDEVLNEVRETRGGTTTVRAMTAEEAPLAVPPLAVVNESTIRTQAAAALQANRTDKTTNDAYLAIASPTNAQNLAQIRELSRQSSRQARQLNQLIRQTYRLFDGTD